MTRIVRFFSLNSSRFSLAPSAFNQRSRRFTHLHSKVSENINYLMLIGDLLLRLVRILLLLGALFRGGFRSLRSTCFGWLTAGKRIGWWTFKCVLQKRKKMESIKKLSQGHRAPRGRFQFKRATAAKMPINHNQRNKFSLVSLHVCNINSFREHFYALEFFSLAHTASCGGFERDARSWWEKLLKKMGKNHSWNSSIASSDAKIENTMWRRCYLLPGRNQ